MRRLGEFLRLSGDDRRLLVRSALLVAFVRLALWCVPFRYIRLALNKWKARTKRSEVLDKAHIRRAAWAVSVISRRLPGATCLVQSITLVLLLGQFGQAANIKVGIAKDGRGQLEAHAWVESGGRIVIGKPHIPTYYTVVSSSVEEIL